MAGPAAATPTVRLEQLAITGARQHVVNVWGVGYRVLDPVTAPERNGGA